jgi:GT2 family glycosyltransferase
MVDAKVLVIVVTYNGAKWFDRCFGSLYASKVPVDIFVVDNGSYDMTVERLQDLDLRGGTAIETEYMASESKLVKLVIAEKNLGFGRANNLGLKYALENGYDYIYLMNEDAWVEPDTIGKMIAASKTNPSYGILSPMQMTADKTKMDPRFAKRFPGRPEGVAKDSVSASKGYAAGSVEVAEVVPVKFVMAAHWLITRDCLETVGGFSPAFSHYGEDDNYIHRAIWHGFSIGVVPDAIAVHDREKRKETKAQRMRLKSVASIVKISNPLNNLAWRLFLQPLELFGIGIRYDSLQSMKDAITMIGGYRDLIRIRKESKTKCPFL